jgi:ADP-ribosyl-[dinitrogen reductase] hydrolase
MSTQHDPGRFRLRTSETNPIRVDALNLTCGRVGMTFCPGKHHDSAYSMVRWERDLEADLGKIRAEGWTHMISLIEAHEMSRFRVPSLGARAVAHGFTWHHFPIVDGYTPAEASLPRLLTLRAEWRAWLRSGASVVVHCRGGLGRAGTIASILLLDTGHAEDADTAIAMVRSVRPGAIEKVGQEAFIRDLAREARLPG